MPFTKYFGASILISATILATLASMTYQGDNIMGGGGGAPWELAGRDVVLNTANNNTQTLEGGVRLARVLVLLTVWGALRFRG